MNIIMQVRVKHLFSREKLQDDDEEDEKEVGAEVVVEEEAGSWVKMKLSLWVFCCVVLCVSLVGVSVFLSFLLAQGSPVSICSV